MPAPGMEWTGFVIETKTEIEKGLASFQSTGRGLGVCKAVEWEMSLASNLQGMDIILGLLFESCGAAAVHYSDKEDNGEIVSCFCAWYRLVGISMRL